MPSSYEGRAARGRHAGREGRRPQRKGRLEEGSRALGGCQVESQNEMLVLSRAALSRRTADNRPTASYDRRHLFSTTAIRMAPLTYTYILILNISYTYILIQYTPSLLPHTTPQQMRHPVAFRLVTSLCVHEHTLSLLFPSTLEPLSISYVDCTKESLLRATERQPIAS